MILLISILTYFDVRISANLGIGAAFYYKRKAPEKYERAGRLINEGL